MMVKQQWSQRPFKTGSDMKVPVFDLISGTPTGEIVELDQKVWNQPLRRDIIHNVFEYFEHRGKSVWKRAKTVGDVSGSGIKPSPQKGSGRARQGNKRAPQRKGGGVAHGPVPRSLEFPINNKKRIMALKCMLSAKLFEDKLVFIDSEQIDFAKTQLLNEIVTPFGLDKLCFLIPQDPDNENFEFAARNIKNVVVKRPQQFHVPDLLRNDYILCTKQGLIDLETIIEARVANSYRNKKIPNDARIEEKRNKFFDSYDNEIIKPILESDELEGYDDDLPLQLQSESLKTYIDDLKKLQIDAEAKPSEIEK